MSVLKVYIVQMLHSSREGERDARQNMEEAHPPHKAKGRNKIIHTTPTITTTKTTPHLDRLDRIVLIMGRTRGTRQMVYLIDLEQYRERDVVPDQREVGMVKPVLDVRLPSREEVVQHDYLVSLGHETIDEMGSHESRPTGDEYLLP